MKDVFSYRHHVEENRQTAYVRFLNFVEIGTDRVCSEQTRLVPMFFSD